MFRLRSFRCERMRGCLIRFSKIRITVFMRPNQTPKSPPTYVVYRTILKSSTHPRERARTQTLGAALFFCMRSCEYSKTPRTEEQKTRPIRPIDVTFRFNGRIIPHDHPNLHLSNTVSITFGPQKSEIMDETATQFKTDDPILCPCILWASVIKRLRSYPNLGRPIFTFYDGNRFTYLTSKEYSIDIKAAVDAIGPEILGFSGGAMMMYLAKNHPYTIMMLGR